MGALNQDNHSGPLCVNRLGMKRTTNIINPNDALLLCGGVDDGDSAQFPVHVFATIFRVLREFNGEGRLEFYPGDYTMAPGNPERFPQIRFVRDINSPSWGAIRYNFDTPAFERTVDTGATWAPIGGAGGSASFIGLTDVPASYVGHAGKAVVVNVGESALEFITMPGGGGGGGDTVKVVVQDGVSGYLNDKIKPAAGSGITFTPVDPGNGNMYLRINVDRTGLVRGVGLKEYSVSIVDSTGDLVVFDDGDEVLRVAQATGNIILSKAGAGIQFLEDVKVYGTNSNLDFTLATAELLIGKPFRLETSNWTIGSNGISTGLTARGGYVQDV